MFVVVCCFAYNENNKRGRVVGGPIRRWRVIVKMEVYFDGEYWCARGMGEDIFTFGATVDELYENIKEAVATHFGETADPISILTLTELSLADAKAS